MNVLQIAAVRGDAAAVLSGVREYPASALLLLHTSRWRGAAQDVLRSLEPLRIDAHAREVQGTVVDEVIHVVGHVLRSAGGSYDQVLLNVGDGAGRVGCGAIAAAYIYGVPAFGVEEDVVFPLPVLRGGYHGIIRGAKLRILQALQRMGGEARSLQELSDATGIEKSLLSYHLHAGEGRTLRDMGLIALRRQTRGRLSVRLTPIALALLLHHAEARPGAPPAPG